MLKENMKYIQTDDITLKIVTKEVYDLINPLIKYKKFDYLYAKAIRYLDGDVTLTHYFRNSLGLKRLGTIYYKKNDDIYEKDFYTEKEKTFYLNQRFTRKHFCEIIDIVYMK